MGGNGQLDPARRSPFGQLIVVRFVLFFAAFAASLCAQIDIAQLYADGQYDAVVAATDNNSQNPDTLFLRGMSLARLERWNEAEQTLRQGQSLAPRDPRFPTELAGVAYRLEDYSRARSLLRRALDLAPMTNTPATSSARSTCSIPISTPLSRRGIVLTSRASRRSRCLRLTARPD